jgi:hypothetical protein
MLFDLRGRGRRRTVQAIYLGLAILMGGGLVLFGVGGATSGGLLDAFNSDSGSVSATDVFKKRIETAERNVATRPTDAKAWADLTRVRYQEAGTGDNFDANQQVFTDKGIAALRPVANAWTKYLTLTKKPDPTVAILMVTAFGPAGLNQPAQAVSAMEIYLDSQTPTAGLYVQYASLAYQAGQTRKAELASAKALQLAPKDDREQVKAALDAAKAQAPAASSATPSATTTPSS